MTRAVLFERMLGHALETFAFLEKVIVYGPVQLRVGVRSPV